MQFDNIAGPSGSSLHRQQHDVFGVGIDPVRPSRVAGANPVLAQNYARLQADLDSPDDEFNTDSDPTNSPDDGIAEVDPGTNDEGRGTDDEAHDSVAHLLPENVREPPPVPIYRLGEDRAYQDGLLPEEMLTEQFQINAWKLREYSHLSLRSFWLCLIYYKRTYICILTISWP